jgi:hypothetical protein
MNPAAPPWSFGGDPNDLKVLRSLQPVIRRAVDALAEGTTGHVSAEFALFADENFTALSLECRLGTIGIERPLDVRILCDADAVGRAYAPDQDDPCGEIADGRLMVSLIDLACAAEIVVPIDEYVTRTRVQLAANTPSACPSGSMVLLMDHTPLGHGGLHVIAGTPTPFDAPVESRPEFLKEPGCFDVSVRNSKSGTEIRIRPRIRVIPVEPLDALGVLRLHALREDGEDA